MDEDNIEQEHEHREEEHGEEHEHREEEEEGEGEEQEQEQEQERKYAGPLRTGLLATVYGWQIDLEGDKAKELLQQGEHIDYNDHHKALLDIDLREIGDPSFPEDFCKSGGTCDELEYPVMVQVQRVRNISAPKTNEESKYAPRMLKLTLTDGHTTIQAVEVEHISNLNINTPPGTKIQLKPGPVKSSHGYLFIEPRSVKLFGGHVAQMVEKWELNRSLAKHTRGGDGENAPPPWIPFGQALDGRDAQDKAFKSLQDAAKLDNPEFEAQRKGAIAEAQKLCGTKKIFGGGTKPMLDANVQKIVDAGFTEEQAENALKIARNNAYRALKILQKKESATEAKKEKQVKAPPEGGKGRKGRGKEHTDEESATPGKPSGKVSLFDFLEDKLPALPESEKTKPEPIITQKDDKIKQDRVNDRRNNPSNRGGKAGSRNVMNKQSSSSFYSGQSNRNDNSFNNHNENQRNYNNYQREDRQYGGYNSQNIQAEKAPRFQKKFDGESKRHQNFNTFQEQTYSQNYQPQQQQQQQQQQHAQISQNMYSNNQNMNENKQISRSFYSPQAVENLTDATANMTFDNQNKYNNVRQNPMQNYQSTYNNYANNKVNYNPPNNFPDQNFRRPNNYQQVKPQPMSNISNGQNMSQSFYSYSDTNMKSQPMMRQPNIMDQLRPVPNNQQNQPNNFNTGNGFYHQPSNMLNFQNPQINEQVRKLPESTTEINWNIGDRCLAKYWEDNGYYDAEITGVSARTVVVRFLAYGNHEEVLKVDCLPANSGGRLYSREGNNMNQNDNRIGRFHQPMYVPPAQRKA